jgi:hypothetical protein
VLEDVPKAVVLSSAFMPMDPTEAVESEQQIGEQPIPQEPEPSDALKFEDIDEIVSIPTTKAAETDKSSVTY